MNVLFIGGTGTISSAISQQVIEEGHSLYLINRGNRNNVLQGDVTQIIVDINEEEKVKEAIKDYEFDVVADFIGFTPEHVERDYRLFAAKTKQYMYISSASAYQKPVKNYLITEETPLDNPYWEYSRNKIACEEILMKLYKETGYPITVIRPSHTYDHRKVPVGLHGNHGNYQVIKRMLEGKSTIIHGDGTSLWTMTHAKDFAKAFIGLMGNDKAIGECIQITSDESLTWNEIYQTIADILQVELKPLHISSELLAACSNYDVTGSLIGDKANTVVFDNTKLKTLVPEFNASISFAEGVKECIDYMLTHKECQGEDPEFDAWADKMEDKIQHLIEEMRG